jgi:hypothetical protein
MNTPKFQFGDLVHVAGYEPQVFSIDGYREEHFHYPDEDWTDLVYELHDVGTGEWIEADQQDLSLVAPVDQADEYLAVNPAPATSARIIIFGLEAEEVKKPERKPTAREISNKEAADRKKARKEKADEIDKLLDELNDYKRLVAEFDDEEHKARVEYTLLKLLELTE